jgi:hypothetical protein
MPCKPCNDSRYLCTDSDYLCTDSDYLCTDSDYLCMAYSALQAQRHLRRRKHVLSMHMHGAAPQAQHGQYCN